MGCMGHCWRKFGKMMGEMENMVRGTVPMMGAAGVGEMLMPAVRVDVCEDEDEVFVVADLPGVERENITACLLSPTQLGIFSERRSETPEAGEGKQIMRQERAFGQHETRGSASGRGDGRWREGLVHERRARDPPQEVRGRAGRADPDRVTIFSHPGSSSTTPGPDAPPPHPARARPLRTPRPEGRGRSSGEHRCGYRRGGHGNRGPGRSGRRRHRADSGRRHRGRPRPRLPPVSPPGPAAPPAPRVRNR